MLSLLVAVQLLSRVQFFAIPGTAALPGIPVLHDLLEFAQIMAIELVMPSKHLNLCCLLLLLPAIFPSIRYPMSKGKEEAAARW